MFLACVRAFLWPTLPAAVSRVFLHLRLRVNLLRSPRWSERTGLFTQEGGDTEQPDSVR